MIKKGTEYRRGPMRPAPSSRILAAFVAIAILGVAFIVVPQGARADANAPTWTSGDFWVYTDASNPNHTLRVDVVGRENTRTLLGTTYDSFHTRETESTGSISVTTDKWVRTSDLGVVNSTVTVFNVVSITTFDPPQAQASFPLSAQKSWAVTLNVSIKIGGGQVFTASTSASAQVEGESDVVVPAGTFHSFSIRGLGGGAYAKLYYSDQAGYWSKKETYNAQDQKTSEMDLRSYHYQWTTTFLLIVVGLIALAAIALAVVSVSFSAIFISWSTSPFITIALYRLALASLILVPFALVNRGVLLALTRRELLGMMAVGAILATHFTLWIGSLKIEGVSVSVASSVILVTSHPLLVGLLSHFVLRERLNA